MAFGSQLATPNVFERKLRTFLPETIPDTFHIFGHTCITSIELPDKIVMGLISRGYSVDISISMQKLLQRAS